MNLLELPFIYNLRFLVAGDQFLTKKFIKDNYRKFKSGSVLDLGCGTGDFASIFSKKDYLGIDVNEKYIEFAKENVGYNFLCLDLDNFRPKDKFDCTIFISTLHHLSESQVKNILSKAVKITKKIIIIVDLNPETDPVRKLLVSMDRGENVRSTQEKLKLLEPFGKVLKIEHFCTRLASQTGIVLKPRND